MANQLDVDVDQYTLKVDGNFEGYRLNEQSTTELQAKYDAANYVSDRVELAKNLSYFQGRIRAQRMFARDRFSYIQARLVHSQRRLETFTDLRERLTQNALEEGSS